MGFFKNILGGGNDSKSMAFSRQEAFCGFLLAIIAADGVITEEETLDFYSAVNKANVMRGISQNAFRSLMKKLVKVLRRDGLETLLQLSAQGLTPDLAKGTFVYACDMVYSDSNVDPNEVRVMDRIKTLLNIDDQFAGKTGMIVKAKASV